MAEALEVSMCDPKVCSDFCEYLVIGLPGTFIMMSDWGSYEILNLLSGILGVNNQAVQVILSNVQILLFNIPFGIQISTCGIIGQLIGANQLKPAIRAEHIIFGFSLLINLLMFGVLSFYKDSLVMIFTRDPQLIELTNTQIQLVLVVCFFDFC